MKNILISICGRGGSKGIPGKNIRMLNGKPLISYSIDAANRFAQSCGNYNTVVALSTDSESIKKVASDFGLDSNYIRPSSLATDVAGKYDVIKDLLLFEEKMRSCQFDLVLDLDITSPLRSNDDLIKAFEIIKSNPEAVNLFSVNKARKNPYFNMVEKTENGFYGLSKHLNSGFLTRQSAPAVYELNASFYFYKRNFFTDYSKTITDKSLIFEMEHTCFDLDEPEDFEFLDFLLVHDKIDFLL